MRGKKELGESARHVERARMEENKDSLETVRARLDGGCSKAWPPVKDASELDMCQRRNVPDQRRGSSMPTLDLPLCPS